MRLYIAVLALSVAAAWLSPPPPLAGRSRGRSSLTALDAAVGIFFGTSTGSTQTCADRIYQELGSDMAAEPLDVDTIDAGELASHFGAHEALIVGTPTWNTGADTERSGTGWDELYYGPMVDLQDTLTGKKVAVFGLGDQVSYAENYADATGELYDVFQNLGCSMYGAWPMAGYEHEDSKAIRGDKFCGLLLDMVNQEEMTDERVTQWIAQLKSEGFIGGATRGGSAAVAQAQTVAAPPAMASVNGAAGSWPQSVYANNASSDYADRIAALERENAALRAQLHLEEGSRILDQNIGVHDSGFTPHRNEKTGRIMWTSPDGRSAYFTLEATRTSTLNP